MADTHELPIFWISKPDDETLELFLRDRSMGTFNHDEHGWAGMEAAEALFRNIASELGVTVQDRGSR